MIDIEKLGAIHSLIEELRERKRTPKEEMTLRRLEILAERIINNKNVDNIEIIVDPPETSKIIGQRHIEVIGIEYYI